MSGLPIGSLPRIQKHCIRICRQAVAPCERRRLARRRVAGSSKITKCDGHRNARISSASMTKPGSSPAAYLDRSSASFSLLTQPLRRELKVHCYRMLGSVHEAEDAVQETFLRAWRSFAKLERYEAVRAWLYRIATNVCLDMAKAAHPRPKLLPDQWSAPTQEMPNGVPAIEFASIEPYPDRELETALEARDPEHIYAAREGVELAFIAAIQQLPPRQRAVLLFIEVLGCSASETAQLLESSTASVNSALQRARAALARTYPSGRPTEVPVRTAAQQALLERYMRAWEKVDVRALIDLLQEDVRYSMPPLGQWYLGRSSVERFFGWAWQAYESYQLLPIGANRQPAFAAYARKRRERSWTLHSIHVLEVQDHGIRAMTLFVQPLSLMLAEPFGLSPSLDRNEAG